MSDNQELFIFRDLKKLTTPPQPPQKNFGYIRYMFEHPLACCMDWVRDNPFSSVLKLIIQCTCIYNVERERERERERESKC